MNAADPRRTTELLNGALETADGDSVSLDHLIESLRTRAFGVLLLMLALPNFIPVPIGIGGVMGAFTVLLGLQMVAGMEHPWVPRWLRAKRIRHLTVLHFLERSTPVMRRLERVCRPRMESLTQRPVTVFTGMLLVLIGVLLALPIPFTNYLFGALLVAYAIALIERDGALLLLLWVVSVGIVAVSASLSGALLRLFGLV